MIISKSSSSQIRRLTYDAFHNHKKIKNMYTFKPNKVLKTIITLDILHL